MIDGVESKLVDFVWMVLRDVSPDGLVRCFPSALVGKASHDNFALLLVDGRSIGTFRSRIRR